MVADSHTLAEELSASFQLEALNAELTALKLDRAYAIVPAGSVLPDAETPPPSSPRPTPQVTALSASFISHALPSFPPSIHPSLHSSLIDLLSHSIYRNAYK